MLMGRINFFSFFLIGVLSIGFVSAIRVDYKEFADSATGECVCNSGGGFATARHGYVLDNNSLTVEGIGVLFVPSLLQEPSVIVGGL